MMASYTVGASERGAYEKTLTADTVDTVTFANDLDKVEVVSDGSAAVYFTVDGSAPTVAGAHCRQIPYGVLGRVATVPTAGGTVVKLISSGTPEYSVSESDD